MNKIKTVFTVKDLENLSGIKAHTLRIWEKRYQIFTPERTGNNTRLYQNDDLRSLLNIAFLNNFGYKISKIAKMSAKDRQDLVVSIYNENSKKELAINDFKLAMLSFDAKLFQNTYLNLCAEKSFREVFYEIFIPLLNEIGLLWQTDTIKPSHEHFISNLIRQKLNSEIEKLHLNTEQTQEKVFVLFLPEEEVHDLGLIFINAELIQKGYRTIFLGDNIPIDDLKDFNNHFDEIVFVTYFTVSPVAENVDLYLQNFSTQILENTSNSLWVLGKQIQYYNQNIPQISTFQGIEALVSKI